MAIHQIEGPDGQIHEIEAPDDATPEEVVAFAEQSIPAAPTEPMGQGEAAGVSAMKGVPFGTDISSGIAALYAKTFGGIPLKEGYDAARESFHLDQAAAREQYPKTAIAGEIGGAVGSSVLIPAKAIQAPTMLGRAVKGAGVGAAFGGAYGFDEGETLGERTGNAIQTGVVSAPFGAAGSVAADLAVRGVGAASRYARGPLTEKAANFLNRRKQAQAPAGNYAAPGAGSADDALRASRPLGAPALAADDLTISAMQGPLKQPVDAALTDGPIPLTIGQLTQNPKAQALEHGAAAGAYGGPGGEAQIMMNRAREVQSDAAKAALEKAAGAEISPNTGQKAAREIHNTMAEAYKSAKAKTNAAYSKVGELQIEAPLKIGADYIRETVAPSLQNWARKGSTGTGFDLNAPGMDYAKKLFNEGTGVLRMDKINSVNFSRMEQWRGRVSQAMADAKNKLPPGIKSSPEHAFLSGMLARYDDAMNALPKEAIKNGDEAIIDALTEARAARSSQGKLFERNKIVMDVLANDDVTNETLVNVLFSGKGRAYNSESATNLQKIIKAAGDKGPDVLNATKAGVYSKIMRNSLTSEIKAGIATEEMVSFDLLTTNLKELINDNPTLFKTLHPDETEQQFMRSVLEASQRIKSAKPGTRNYSNTAYTILNWVRQISPTVERTGMGGMNIGSALKSLGEGGAIVDLDAQLAPVLKDRARQLDGPAYKFFERFAPGAAAATAAQSQTLEGYTPEQIKGFEKPGPAVDLPASPY